MRCDRRTAATDGVDALTRWCRRQVDYVAVNRRRRDFDAADGRTSTADGAETDHGSQIDHPVSRQTGIINIRPTLRYIQGAAKLYM